MMRRRSKRGFEDWRINALLQKKLSKRKTELALQGRSRVTRNGCFYLGIPRLAPQESLGEESQGRLLA
jgi:hypothetical protein